MAFKNTHTLCLCFSLSLTGTLSLTGKVILSTEIMCLVVVNNSGDTSLAKVEHI